MYNELKNISRNNMKSTQNYKNPSKPSNPTFYTANFNNDDMQTLNLVSFRRRSITNVVTIYNKWSIV